MAVTLPTHATGDQLEVSISARGDVTWTGPSGWVLVASGRTAIGSDLGAAVFVKQAASAAETNPTFTISGTTAKILNASASSIRDSGGADKDASNVLIASAQVEGSQSATTWNCPSVTTQGPDRLLVAHGFAGDDRTSTPPSGYTEIADNPNGTAGGGVTVATKVQAAAGASGIATGTWSSGSESCGILIAYAPTSGAPVAGLPADTFNRTDSTVSLGTSSSGHAWQQTTRHLGIIANKAYPGGVSLTAIETVDATVANVKVSASHTLSGASAYLGLIARCLDTSNWLLAALWRSGTNDIIEFYKNDAGVESRLAQGTTAGLALGATYNVDFIADGSTLDLRVDGTSKLTHTLTSAEQTKYGAYTRAGLYAFVNTGYEDGGSRWDDFAVADLAAAVAGFIGWGIPM